MKMPSNKQVLYDLVEAFSRFHRKKMDCFIDSDCKKSETKILMILKKAEPQGLTISDISHHMRVTSPFVTQVMNQLEEGKMISRRTDQKDRRIVRVFLTKKGKQIATKIEKGFQEHFAHLIQHLGEKESKQLAALLHKTFDWMEQKKYKQSWMQDEDND